MKGFRKFKKSEFLNNYMFIQKVIIRIDDQKMIQKFKDTVLEDMTKKEFTIYDKIILVSNTEQKEFCEFKCKKTKFKKFKEVLKEADMKNVGYIDIIMVSGGMCQELDEDDAEVVSKIIKKTCKRYDALVKMKQL